MENPCQKSPDLIAQWCLLNSDTDIDPQALNAQPITALIIQQGTMRCLMEPIICKGPVYNLE